jgi:hypothetical protein
MGMMSVAGFHFVKPPLGSLLFISCPRIRPIFNKELFSGTSNISRLLSSSSLSPSFRRFCRTPMPACVLSWKKIGFLQAGCFVLKPARLVPLIY